MSDISHVKDENSALAAYVIGAREPMDFIDYVREMTPAAIEILRKMLSLPTNGSDMETNKLLADLLPPKPKRRRP